MNQRITYTSSSSSRTLAEMFTFSAKEKDSETGFSYFGSRYYSSDLSIWLSVDPQASKYPSQSNYVYCSNNPIIVVDPNGEDEYEFDECGFLKNIITNNEADIIHVVNEYGDRIVSSESFAYGTISNLEDDASVENDFFPSLTLFQVSDFETSDAVFNFLADNTSVEWGNVLSEDVEGNCISFVGTNHDESSVRVRKTLSDRGYSVDRSVHNHPNGINFISEKDHKGAEIALMKNSQIQLYLYTTAIGLIRYDQKSSYMDNNLKIHNP